MKKNDSPYSAAMTGCGLLYSEFVRVLPLLMDSHAEELLKEEILNNNLMQVNSHTSRLRFAAEFSRRYKAVPATYWEEFLKMGESAQRVGLLYVILNTYKLIFDFHFHITMKRWNSVEQTVTKNDLMLELSDISSRDPFVDSWSDKTKNRCASQYLTILKQVGMLDGSTNELHRLVLDASEYEYYLRHDEEWFLEACLLYPYEIEDIKQKLI